MTLTIEVAPETQAWLEAEAARLGLSLGQLAGDMLDDALQDIEDVEEARRVLADDSEPNVSLAQLQTELKQRREGLPKARNGAA